MLTTHSALSCPPAHESMCSIPNFSTVALRQSRFVTVLSRDSRLNMVGCAMRGWISIQGSPHPASSGWMPSTQDHRRPDWMSSLPIPAPTSGTGQRMCGPILIPGIRTSRIFVLFRIDRIKIAPASDVVWFSVSASIRMDSLKLEVKTGLKGFMFFITSRVK